MIERIAILGTGLLGTSVGLALRAAGYRGSIMGWNRSPEQGKVALSMGAVDSIVQDPLQAAQESQVMLLAVPIYATLDFMEQLSRLLGPDQLVTDVGSTKGAEIACGRASSSTMRNVRLFFPGIPWRAKNAAALPWRMRACFAEPSGSSPMIPRGSAHFVRQLW